MRIAYKNLYKFMITLPETQWRLYLSQVSVNKLDRHSASLQVRTKSIFSIIDREMFGLLQWKKASHWFPMFLLSTYSFSIPQHARAERSAGHVDSIVSLEQAKAGLPSTAGLSLQWCCWRILHFCIGVRYFCTLLHDVCSYYVVLSLAGSDMWHPDFRKWSLY